MMDNNRNNVSFPEKGESCSLCKLFILLLSEAAFFLH